MLKIKLKGGEGGEEERGKKTKWRRQVNTGQRAMEWGDRLHTGCSFPSSKHYLIHKIKLKEITLNKWGI